MPPKVLAPETERIGDVDVFASSREGIERAIQQAGLRGEQAQQARLEHQAKVLHLRRQAAKAQYGQSGGPLAVIPGFDASNGGGPLRFAMNYGDAVIPRVASTGAAALTAPITAARRGIGMGDAYQMNREQALNILGGSRETDDGVVRTTAPEETAARIASVVAPTPLNKVGQMAYAAGGGAALARGAAQAPTFAQAAMKQLGSALIGGTSAATATNLVAGATDERPIGQVLQDQIDMVNPTKPAGQINMLLGAGAAAFPIGSRVIQSKEMMGMYETAKRVLGPAFKPSPDMLRTGKGFWYGIIDSLSKTSAGMSSVRKFTEDAFYKPLREARESFLKRRSGVTDVEAARSKGASAIRELVPRWEVDAAGKWSKAKGSLGEARERIGRAAFNSMGERQIPRQSLAGLESAIISLDKAAAKAGKSGGERGGSLSTLLSDIRSDIVNEARGNHPFNLQMMENYRARLADIAEFGDHIGRNGINVEGMNARTTREAKELYGVVRGFMGTLDEGMDSALSNLEQLHAVETQLSEVANMANLGDDVQLFRAAMTAPNFEHRMAVLDRVLPKDRMQAIRGAYVADFMDEISVLRGSSEKQELVPLARIMDEKLAATSGPFRRAVAERVMGKDAINELHDMARVSDWFMQSAVSVGEGSATNRRIEDMKPIYAAASLFAHALQIARNDGATAGAIEAALGLAGKAAMAGGVLNGHMGDILRRAATGGEFQVNRTAPMVAERSGGIAAMLNALTGSDTNKQQGPQQRPGAF